MVFPPIHLSVSFYFADESEPSLVSSAKIIITIQQGRSSPHPNIIEFLPHWHQPDIRRG